MRSGATCAIGRWIRQSALPAAAPAGRDADRGHGVYCGQHGAGVREERSDAPARCPACPGPSMRSGSTCTCDISPAREPGEAFAIPTAKVDNFVEIGQRKRMRSDGTQELFIASDMAQDNMLPVLAARDRVAAETTTPKPDAGTERPHSGCL